MNEGTQIVEGEVEFDGFDWVGVGAGRVGRLFSRVVFYYFLEHVRKVVEIYCI